MLEDICDPILLRGKKTILFGIADALEYKQDAVKKTLVLNLLS